MTIIFFLEMLFMRSMLSFYIADPGCAHANGWNANKQADPTPEISGAMSMVFDGFTFGSPFCGRSIDDQGARTRNRAQDGATGVEGEQRHFSR